MSENYGDCKGCKGMGVIRAGRELDGTIATVECGTCGGTGMGGSAMDYVANTSQADREQEHRDDAGAQKEWDK